MRHQNYTKLWQTPIFGIGFQKTTYYEKVDFKQVTQRTSLYRNAIKYFVVEIYFGIKCIEIKFKIN